MARALARAFTDNHKFRGGKGGHGAPDGGLCWTREARRMGCAGLRIWGLVDMQRREESRVIPQ